MRPSAMTQRIRDRGISIVASDIPPEMTMAQYRKRQLLTTGPSTKSPFRRLRALQ
jgi:hypothetical protein